jgi:hypothetical protein
MITFDLTVNAQVELKGGIMSPIGTIVEVKVAGLQYPDLQPGQEGFLGWVACLFLDETQKAANNHLLYKEDENNPNPTTSTECMIGNVSAFSEFTLETDNQGQLTQASIDSLREAVKPKIAPVLGIQASDLS